MNKQSLWSVEKLKYKDYEKSILIDLLMTEINKNKKLEDSIKELKLKILTNESKDFEHINELSNKLNEAVNCIKNNLRGTKYE